MATNGDPNTYDPTTTNPDGTPIQTQPIQVDVTGTTPPVANPATNAAPVATAAPGTDWASILSKAFPAVANLINSNQAQGNASTLANNISGMADKYGAIANPYGAYRDAAAQKLAALQADPSSIVNTPGYKFSLQQGLGAVANRDNRSFGVGAGSTNPDLMNFAQGLASKTYNDTINQYSAQAGVGQSTAPAAGIYGAAMQGIAQNQAAANAAQGATLNNAGAAVGALLPAGSALLKQLTSGGMPLAQATQLVKGIPGMTGASTGGSAGGDIPKGSPSPLGDISNGDGTFESPSGQIVDISGQPIDQFAGGGAPSITDISSGLPSSITDPTAAIPNITDPNFDWSTFFSG